MGGMVYVDNDKVATLLEAFLERREVQVSTASRDFRGDVEGVYHSPFHFEFRATVVDAEGRVHNFYPERHCEVEA
jgi:hypothetical protein